MNKFTLIIWILCISLVVVVCRGAPTATTDATQSETTTTNTVTEAKENGTAPVNDSTSGSTDSNTNAPSTSNGEGSTGASSSSNDQPTSSSGDQSASSSSNEQPTSSSSDQSASSSSNDQSTSSSPNEQPTASSNDQSASSSSQEEPVQTTEEIPEITEPILSVIRPLYIDSATLKLTPENPGTSDDATVPDSGEVRQLPIYTDPNNVLVLRANGVNGRYSPYEYAAVRGEPLSKVRTQFLLWVDSRDIAAQGVVARIMYDWTGDGTWDRIEQYDVFATNDLLDYEAYSSEAYLPTEITGGGYQNFTDGKLRIELWSTFATCCPLFIRTGLKQYNEISMIQTPHFDLTSNDVDQTESSTSQDISTNSEPIEKEISASVMMVPLPWMTSLVLLFSALVFTRIGAL